MPTPDRPAARQASAYLHPVRRDLGTRSRRNVSHVGNSHSLMLESASASRTCVPRYGHLYDRLCDLIWGRQLAVAEHPLTRLAPRPLGAGGPPALGERSRLALSGSLEFCELLAQPFVGRRQLGVLPLQLGNLPLQPLDQRHQLVAFTRTEDFGLTHSQSLKHLPSTTATPPRAA